MFKRISIRHDLGLQLLALYLLFVGPVVLAALAFDSLASQRLEADIKAGDLALARAIAQETNTTMDNALQSVENLAEYPEVINADLEGMDQLFSTVMSARPEVNLVYRLDSNGIMLFHMPAGPGSTVGVDFSFRDYHQAALTTRDPLISLGRISPTTAQPVATAVMPLWNETGDFLGLVAMNIRLQSLSDTLTSIAAEYRPQEDFNVMIIDASGRVIARPNPRSDNLLVDISQDLAEVVQSALDGRSNNLIGIDRDGQEVLYSFVPVPRAGWGVIVSRPASVAFATPQAFHQGVLLLIAVFLGIGLIFWIALSRQVIRPLERLAALSRMIGRQQDISAEQRSYLQSMADRPDQMGYLIRSLTRMEGAIEARLNELSTLLQTSAAVVSSLDSKTVLERILEQVEHLLEVKKCAIVALDEEAGIFRAQASRGLSPRYTGEISIDPAEPQSVSLRAIRSGQPVQISDVEQDGDFAFMLPRSRAEGFRSVLAVPLNAQHAPPSALLVYRPDPHEFGEREINLLTNFANHAAMAIENAALYARSDMRLQEQTRRLEALIQSLQDGLILENLEGRVLYANRRICELLDLSSEEISGVPVEKLIERLISRSSERDPARREQIRQAVLAALNGSGDRRVEISIQEARRDRYVRLQIFDVTDAQGMPFGRGQILSDITTSREVDRMKSSLISTVSHELRTPLAAIKGYATTLLAEDVAWDPHAQREFLEIISAETDRLSDLVNDLLDMSRIEAGNLTVSRIECDLRELVERAARRSHPAPGSRLHIDLPADLPAFFADPKRIEAVLRNLIENAAKYAGEDSPITVTAARRSNQIVVRVEDQGPGIPPEESERIFESFYRVENGLIREAPGAGIGLAICQGFIQAHGGEIWLEPRSQGTSVAFSLPLAESEPYLLADAAEKLKPHR